MRKSTHRHTQWTGMLLAWSKLQAVQFAPLPWPLLREICAYLGPDILCFAWITHCSVRFLDIEQRGSGQPAQFVFLKTTIQASNSSRCVVLSRSSCLVCGGISSTEVYSTAYLVTRDGEVSCKPSMQWARGSHGATLWCGSVCVFGSSAGSGTRTCESLADTAECWKELPSMQMERADFTPVLWRNAVYLCGGDWAGTVEVLEGQSMRLLELMLPEAGKAMTYVWDDSLMILQSSNVSSLSRASEVLLSKNKQWNAVETCTNPVVWHGVVYQLIGRVLIWKQEAHHVFEVRRYSPQDGSRHDSLREAR